MRDIIHVYLVATWWLYSRPLSPEKTLASPKSAIFKCPVGLINKLAGFRSYIHIGTLILKVYLHYTFNINVPTYIHICIHRNIVYFCSQVSMRVEYSYKVIQLHTPYSVHDGVTV